MRLRRLALNSIEFTDALNSIEITDALDSIEFAAVLNSMEFTDVLNSIEFSDALNSIEMRCKHRVLPHLSRFVRCGYVVYGIFGVGVGFFMLKYVVRMFWCVCFRVNSVTRVSCLAVDV